VSVWSAIVQRSEELWKRPALGKALIFIASCFVVHWVWHVPPSNYSLIAMAVVAGLMALRQEMSGWERSVWAMILIVFAIIEIGAINHDNAIRDAAQRQALQEEREHFGNIRDDIKQAIQQSQQQFTETMARSDAITKGLTEAIELETGGNSYILFAIGDPFLMRGVSGSHFARNGMHFDKPIDVMSASAIAGVVGKYPVHNVHVSISGPFGMCFDHDYGTMAANELGRPREFPYLEFIPNKKRQYFHISINGSNGNYYQNVLFLEFNGKWVWGSRLYKGGSVKGKPIKMLTGKGFPKNYSDADWFKGNE
jgi:hypothetical protein